MAVATGAERYRRHQVWDTLTLKRQALEAARFDDTATEQWRLDIVEWLAEAAKTKTARQPALYLKSLDGLSAALNELPIGTGEFQQYVGTYHHYPSALKVRNLEAALRALPLPPPKDLGEGYARQLDREVQARADELVEFEARIAETEAALQARRDELAHAGGELDALKADIQREREQIAAVSAAAQDTINAAWDESLGEWGRTRAAADEKQNAAALTHVATLAATASAGRALAEHAAGDLSAADWSGRAKRERRAAQWMRAGAAAAFIFAGAVGWFIVSEAIENNFDLTLGDGILRAAVAAVIGAFGGLLLRESGRHFREADTAEDVALSLKALAPFYANTADEVRLTARVQLGDAVLVRNLLSRFAHRDAAKHAGGVDMTELPGVVKEATEALKLTQSADKPPG